MLVWKCKYIYTYTPLYINKYINILIICFKSSHWANIFFIIDFHGNTMSLFICNNVKWACLDDIYMYMHIAQRSSLVSPWIPKAIFIIGEFNCQIRVQETNMFIYIHTKTVWSNELLNTAWHFVHRVH